MDREHGIEVNGRESPRTVDDLCERFLAWAEEYYRKPVSRRPTREAANIRCALRALRAVAGGIPPAELSADVLCACQDWMIGAGQARRTINANVRKIRRVIRWAVQPPRRWLPAGVLADLQTVDPLMPGRTAAPDYEPVKPVPDAVIEATLPALSSQVRTMILVQLLTGMRPGEVTLMRGCDIDQGDATWRYKPHEHKTEHYGHDRIIHIGPQAQDLLRPFLRRDPADYLFDPRDAVSEWNNIRYRLRVTPLSCGNIPGSNRKLDPRRVPGERYTTQSYRQTIHRGCDRVFPPPEPLAKRPGETEAVRRGRLTAEQRVQLKAWQKVHRWSPNQLRHSAATRLHRDYGMDAARAILGHTTAATTAIYTEMDHAHAAEVMACVG